MSFQVIYSLSSFDCFKVTKTSRKEYLMQQLPSQLHKKTTPCLIIQLFHTPECVSQCSWQWLILLFLAKLTI